LAQDLNSDEEGEEHQQEVDVDCPRCSRGRDAAGDQKSERERARTEREGVPGDEREHERSGAGRLFCSWRKLRRMSQ